MTLETDCPELVRRCAEDRDRCGDARAQLSRLSPDGEPRGAGARREGIATVIMGSAKDIVEYVGVPRLLFSDFPLGNSAGRPNDPASQDFTLALALELLEAAPAARTTVQSPLRWSTSTEWKLDYCNIARLTPEEIARRRAAFDAQKTIAKQLRQSMISNEKNGRGQTGATIHLSAPWCIGGNPRAPEVCATVF